MSSLTIRRAIIAAALSALLPLSVADAHADLVSASPGPDEAVTEVPARLVARFSEDLAADRTSIEVRDASGATVARGGKDPDRARAQRADLPPLEPGTYEVRWVTYSTEDGELARGRYSFTVSVPVSTPGPTSAGAPCPTPEPSAPASLTPGASVEPAASTVPSASGASPASSPAIDPAASTMPRASTLPTAPGDPCASPIGSIPPLAASPEPGTEP